MAVDEGGAAMAEEIAPALRMLVEPTRIEPQALVPMRYAPRPSEPVRVWIAQLTLRRQASFRPPAGPCQDVLLFVREGELRAVGSGIAPPEAPSTLYAGDAVRFGPEGDGLVQNMSDRQASTVVAFVRPEGAGEPSTSSAGGAGCPAPRSDDPLVSGIRSASVRTTPSNEVLGGRLRVHILLDEDGAGATYGGLSVLEGDPDLVVPRHRHPDAAEILFIEEGAGVFHIGEISIRVRAGTALYVPRGELHGFEGDGTTPLRAIQVYTPSGPEQRFRE